MALLSALALAPSLAAEPGDLAALTAPSPERLCRSLRAANDAGRCTVVRRASRNHLAAAVLRLTGDRSTELWIAAATAPDGTWQLVRSAGVVYNFQDLRGALAIREFTVHQLIPGGPSEIDLAVERWQTTQATPDDCHVHRTPELHRYVAARVDDEWRSLALTTAIEPSSTHKLADECVPPPWTPPPTWSLTLEFQPDALTIRAHSGHVPEDIRPTLTTHALADVLVPTDHPPVLATLPDTI